eukprot:2036605-Prymnesium_polylepis.1
MAMLPSFLPPDMHRRRNRLDWCKSSCIDASAAALSAEAIASDSNETETPKSSAGSSATISSMLGGP